MTLTCVLIIIVSLFVNCVFICTCCVCWTCKTVHPEFWRRTKPQGHEAGCQTDELFRNSIVVIHPDQYMNLCI